MGADERRLEVSWSDPAELARASREMEGVDLMRAIIDGSLPRAPIQDLLGFELDDAEDGRVVFSAVPGERHYNPIGVVHAGLAATMLDSAMGAAVHTTLTKGLGYTTLETKFNLTRPITTDTGRIVAEGKVVHRGRQLATADGRVTDERGKLLAHGTSTCLLFETG
jgi:uncharacterized protein (TIGR00369 family)